VKISDLPTRIATRTTEIDKGYRTPCWVCDLSVNRWGYARVRWPTGTSSKRVVHRVTYELFVGPVLEGLELDHLCRVPACCRPDHMEPVTKQANTQRSTAGAWRAQVERAKTHCPAGHEYSFENTWVNKRGHRFCRKCHADRARAAWQAARVEVKQDEQSQAD
jgi:HNH endonuclease